MKKILKLAKAFEKFAGSGIEDLEKEVSQYYQEDLGMPTEAPKMTDKDLEYIHEMADTGYSHEMALDKVKEALSLDLEYLESEDTSAFEAISVLLQAPLKNLNELPKEASVALTDFVFGKVLDLSTDDKKSLVKALQAKDLDKEQEMLILNPILESLEFD